MWVVDREQRESPGRMGRRDKLKEWKEGGLGREDCSAVELFRYEGGVSGTVLLKLVLNCCTVGPATGSGPS